MKKTTATDNALTRLMAEWGRRGAAARTKALSPRRRREIARKAAAASAGVRTAKARARRRGK